MGLLSRKESMKKRAKDFSKDKLGVISLIIILAFIVISLFPGLFSPYPEQGRGISNVANALTAPSQDHLFGTDRQGRDILSRIMYGMQTSLKVAFIVTIIAIVIGVTLGAIAGFIGGIVDEIIMRLTDIFLAFPALLLAIALVAALGPSLENAILAIAISWWPWYCRIVRSSTLTLKNALFIEAAKVYRISKFRIILRHIIPNVMTPVIVQASIDIGSVILAAASLSFLGLGATPPTADLGQMVSEGRSYILGQWWYSTMPGLAILLLVMSFNILGDALRDFLDPKNQRG